MIAEYERLQDGDTAVSGELKTEVAHAEVRRPLVIHAGNPSPSKGGSCHHTNDVAS